MSYFLTVQPADTNNLKKCQKHDGHDGRVVIHQLEHIDSDLRRELSFISQPVIIHKRCHKM